MAKTACIHFKSMSHQDQNFKITGLLIFFFHCAIKPDIYQKWLSFLFHKESKSAPSSRYCISLIFFSQNLLWHPLLSYEKKALKIISSYDQISKIFDNHAEVETGYIDLHHIQLIVLSSFSYGKILFLFIVWKLHAYFIYITETYRCFMLRMCML